MRKPKLMPVTMYSRIYIAWSKFLHKRGYHYAPKRYSPEPHTPHLGLDGQPITQWYHWCQWCGLRGTTIDVTSRKLSQQDTRSTQKPTKSDQENATPHQPQRGVNSDA